MPKYPKVEVQLVGKDGNALVLIAEVTVAMKKSGIDKGEVDLFRQQAMSSTYDDLLRTCMEWVSVS